MKLRHFSTTGTLCGILVFVWSLISVPSESVAFQETVHPLSRLRTLNGYFPFEPPATLAEWEIRKARLKRDLQVSLGLWPLPEKSPLNAVIHSPIDMGEYTIEKVYFESFPGFYVTGNLYRPKNVSGVRPAVLSPHGHFRNGRFHQQTDEEVARALASGAEQFESNARNKLLARCANLAIMGCVVFHYDMLGYADSQQITSDVAHGFRTQREYMNSPDAWGLFSPQAELRLQSVMGLQTWNSIRSLDFLCSLPDVDSDRIGVTGASGGGTQTFILCALDSRPAASFPAVMVSTAMQGGCTCENCCNLRVNAGNVDFAALFAPKPQAFTAADDWTREMETKGMPELVALYQLYMDSGEDVELPQLTSRTEFPHNYNQVSREAMYRFFNRHLKMNIDNPFEVEIRSPGPNELSVYDDLHAAPGWSDEREMALLRHWESSSQPFGPDSVETSASLQEFRTRMRGALESIVAHPDSEVEFEVTATRATGETKYGILKADDQGIRADVSISVNREISDGPILVRVNSEVGRDLPSVVQERMQAMESEEVPVWASIEIPAEPSQNTLVANGRAAAGYTFGYNRSLLAWRVSQILYFVQYLRAEFPDRKIILCSGPTTAPETLVAFSVSGLDGIAGLICDPGDFSFGSVSGFEDPNFLPGALKYGDVEGMLCSKAEGSITLVVDEGRKFPLLRRAAELSDGQLVLLER